MSSCMCEAPKKGRKTTEELEREFFKAHEAVVEKKKDAKAKAKAAAKAEVAAKVGDTAAAAPAPAAARGPPLETERHDPQ